MPSSQPSVLSLPISLLLLLHLHILDYPFANNPENDHNNIFNPRVRGLRDRIKSMEDICYFLVARLEDQKHHATLLPTYPCLQPSDTTSFRASLAKYLETLRHRSLQSSSGENNTTGNDFSRNVAWWWKDVVVRKSLLEECSGERFERLLLTLSTHAVLKGAPAAGQISLHCVGTTLATVPKDYMTLLAISQSEKHNWKRSASLLLFRQNDIRTLREHLAKTDEHTTSTFGTLSTDRLLALSESKFRDILRDHWPGYEGDVALRFLKVVGGLKASSVRSSISSLGQNGDEMVSTSRDVGSQNPAVSLPLPIAAAYHPAKMRNLRAPIFSSSKVHVSNKPPKTSSLEPDPISSSVIQGTTTHASIVLSDWLDTEIKMRQALGDALARAKSVGQELNAHPTKPRTDLDRLALDLDLPAEEDHEELGVDFKTHATPVLLVSLSLHPPASDETLQSRINYIRGSLLPGLPSIPQPRPIFSPTQITSKLPSWSSQPPTKVASKSIGEASGKPLVLKIPPVAITTRPTHASKFANTHETSRRKSMRHSLAHMHRPSLYGGQGLRDEVYRIVDTVRDNDDLQYSQADDLEDVLTPKAKTKGTRLDTHTTSRVRRWGPSIPMSEPSHALPPLTASSSQDFLHGTTDSKGQPSLGDAGNNVYSPEAPSMTLRDILLHAADTTQFDLLGQIPSLHIPNLLIMTDGTKLVDESFGWD